MGAWSVKVIMEQERVQVQEAIKVLEEVHNQEKEALEVHSQV